MEIFLNLLWLAIAMALLGVWRSRWAVQPREREYPGWRQWTAVVCALIFLFFMVSITDDLHSDVMVFEESSAARRQATSLDGPHHATPHQAAWGVYAILGSANPARVSHSLGSIALEHRVSGIEAAPSPNSGRAPPVISL